MSLQKYAISCLNGIIFLSLITFSSLHASEPAFIACGCNYGQTYPPMSQSFENIPYYTPPEAPTTLTAPTTEKVIRAAIDIGSGATKLRVAEVNLKTHKIDKIIINESYPVQYHEKLSKSSNNTFDNEVMQTGIDAIKQSAAIAKQYGADKVVAVATASFRKAANSQELIDRIYKETGVKVYVIDQDLEGKLAFNAVMSQENYSPDDLVVWDIGGGSLQLTALNKEGQYEIFRGEVASIHFKNMIIDEIQHKDSNQISTPNPMTEKEIQQSTVMAKDLAQKVDRVFKDRMLQPNTKVVGVGNIFAYGLYPVVGKKSPFTQKELSDAVFGMAGKDDQQLGGGDYANVQLSNLILILGNMQTLNIQQMEVLDINNADGALLYQDFWN
jgi:exopolyphosphatase / guanosine-5'-triphosphate,3'-diphosphate pyrophosphatase